MLAAVERYTRRRARGLGGILRPEEVRRRIGEAGGGAAAGSGEPIGDAMARVSRRLIRALAICAVTIAIRGESNFKFSHANR